MGRIKKKEKQQMIIQNKNEYKSLNKKKQQNIYAKLYLSVENI